MRESLTPARIAARHDRSESARLDNFVAGAFAFAITLPIISARINLARWAYCAAIGLPSAPVALAAPPTGAVWPISAAGFSYALLGTIGIVVNRYRQRLEARQTA